MNSSREHKEKPIRPVAVSVVVCTVVLLVLVQLLGCGKSETLKKQEQYGTEWKTIMTAFDSRVTSDDKKANELVEQGDISGLINLIEQRIENADLVIEEILGLRPPKKFERLQAITLYYLVSLRDQLDAQNDLNEAALSGKPTADLMTISDGAAAKTQQVGGELGVEIQKVGIKMGEEEVEEKKDDEKKDEKSGGDEPKRE